MVYIIVDLNNWAALGGYCPRMEKQISQRGACELACISIYTTLGRENKKKTCLSVFYVQKVTKHLPLVWHKLVNPQLDPCTEDIGLESWLTTLVCDSWSALSVANILSTGVWLWFNYYLIIQLQYTQRLCIWTSGKLKLWCHEINIEGVLFL